ncbi:hypothetical protein SNE35_29820 [Paucibacter sp. R3-3]|uniref:Uncharacterized protein n=1 Tax=Roseateles agri TaxID=3098619 RepID=A0ABU5DRI9_9BURK|nr:hypothetical protein [Paucibacter sp. R3-3]MDY0748734.1 hypothetical protein [Paucibacter sp. R3-3]
MNIPDHGHDGVPHGEAAHRQPGPSRPRLADPNFEPTDQQLQEVAERAWNAAAQAHAAGLGALEHVLAEEVVAARRRVAAQLAGQAQNADEAPKV